MIISSKYERLQGGENGAHMSWVQQFFVLLQTHYLMQRNPTLQIEKMAEVGFEKKTQNM